eukprot:Selendium_serpulae@DN4890_c1_g1_i2.p1
MLPQKDEIWDLLLEVHSALVVRRVTHHRAPTYRLVHDFMSFEYRDYAASTSVLLYQAGHASDDWCVLSEADFEDALFFARSRDDEGSLSTAASAPSAATRGPAFTLTLRLATREQAIRSLRAAEVRRAKARLATRNVPLRERFSAALQHWR